jgi:hypothetical protein
MARNGYRSWSYPANYCFNHAKRISVGLNSYCQPQKHALYFSQDTVKYGSGGYACCGLGLRNNADDIKHRACKAGPAQWCVFASYLQYPSSQKMGKQVAMNGDDMLKMTCLFLLPCTVDDWITNDKGSRIQ